MPNLCHKGRTADEWVAELGMSLIGGWHDTRGYRQPRAVILPGDGVRIPKASARSYQLRVDALRYIMCSPVESIE